MNPQMPPMIPILRGGNKPSGPAVTVRHLPIPGKATVISQPKRPSPPKAK
jgi:hypothetical protein